MDTLTYLDAFILSAESGSFSAAARRLGQTPAAVSKNVARLEAAVGARLFQRSTRSVTLTEAGERFLARVTGPVGELQEAIAGLAQDAGAPAGRLKVGCALAFGRTYLLPLLAQFLERHPAVLPDWQFDNRQVDLVGDGFDAAIGGGIELAPGVVARELARVRIIATAAPAFLARHGAPEHPPDLAALPGIARRSAGSGRLRDWTLRNGAGDEAVAECRTVAVFDDPEAMAHAAALGLGIALLPTPHAVPMLESGALVHILPAWDADAGPLSIYYSSKRLLPAKTRAFVDFIVASFRDTELAARLRGPPRA